MTNLTWETRRRDHLVQTRVLKELLEKVNLREDSTTDKDLPTSRDHPLLMTTSITADLRETPEEDSMRWDKNPKWRDLSHLEEVLQEVVTMMRDLNTTTQGTRWVKDHHSYSKPKGQLKPTMKSSQFSDKRESSTEMRMVSHTMEEWTWATAMAIRERCKDLNLTDPTTLTTSKTLDSRTSSQSLEVERRTTQDSLTSHVKITIYFIKLLIIVKRDQAD